MSDHDYQPSSKLGKWFNDRLPLLTLSNHLQEYPTPKNLNYWWTFGGILTFCLITQIITGIILGMHYIAHADLDYFDDEMATQIRGWIDELFERNPNMIEQRVEMKLMLMRVNHYWGGHNEGLDAAEEAMRIAREADRPDLELEALEMHGSIQTQRYGGIQNMPQGRKRRGANTQKRTFKARL